MLLLHKRMTSLLASGGVLTIGTLFTGCEILFLVAQYVLRLLQAQVGGSNRAVLKWIVEKDAWKREFVQKRHAPGLGFDDVIELSKSGWQGTDCFTGEKATLTKTDLFVAGFECDTVSRLSHTKDCGACMEMKEGKTGTTGRATYCASRSPVSS